MLTKSQKIMAADGFPVKMFLTQAQRAAAWNANPNLGIEFTHSFKTPKEDKYHEMRAQLKREETDIRIRKMLGAQSSQSHKAFAIRHTREEMGCPTQPIHSHRHKEPSYEARRRKNGQWRSGNSASG